MTESVTDKQLSRRQFVGAAAGSAAALGAGAVLAPSIASAAGATPAARAEAGAAKPLAAAPAVAQPSAVPSSWDYQADVVVIGGGGVGIPAAIAAAQGGASVLVVEAFYDCGGKAIVSAGGCYFGGGNSAQLAYGIKDSPDLVFADLTSPVATYFTSEGTHYADREMARVIADGMVPTWNWMSAMGVQWTCTAVANTPPSGTTTWVSGTARSESPYWNGASTWPCSAMAPAGTKGTGLMRPLEATARGLGVQFLMNFRMTSIIREQPYSGRVLGITAEATGGVFVPGSTMPLQSYFSEGNISLENANVNIRANRAVIIASGGAASNIAMRREMDPRLTAVYSCSGDPYAPETGDGIYAARRIGAALWAASNQGAENDTTLRKVAYIGCQYSGASPVVWTPTSPLFPLARAGGLLVATANYDGILHVNMAGARFFNESASASVNITNSATSLSPYNMTSNTSPTSFNWIDAAMSINAASTPPDYAAGPIWAIFDSALVTRAGWVLGYPNTDPLFFFQANTIAGLAPLINTNAFQTTSMDPTVLTATVSRYNSLVAAGKGDADFGKTPFTYQINTPPYYAAWATPEVWQWYGGGVHIDPQTGQVLDLDGNAIPSLYAAGEAVGGSSMHGLTKHIIYARMIGANAAQESINVG